MVGESGSGKSQTAMSILQLFQRNQYIAEGQIRFDGKNILALSKKELLKIRGNDISMIFQEPYDKFESGIYNQSTTDRSLETSSARRQ
ncbi:MAG: ATP-binding cassette domain-containing protein [Enterococcus casseliflavus]